MKISTKFNLCVGCFFFFVFMAVLYSYCGGLNVCYSFPFLNGIGKGSVTMTSYILNEKDESRDNAGDAIYFYSKIKGNPNKVQTVHHGKPDTSQKTELRPGDEENNTKKKTGSSRYDPPSVITGKTAEDILKKANVSAEESNRELFREEKVDKQVDREASRQSTSIQSRTTSAEKDRGKLGSRFTSARAHPIRKLPRKLRKKFRKKTFNGFAKQDHIDKELERKLDEAENAMHMHGNSSGSESRSLKTSYLHVHGKTPLKVLKMNYLRQDERVMNDGNDAVNPLDVIKYRNEASIEIKRQLNRTKSRNEGSNTLQHPRNKTESSTPYLNNTKGLRENMTMRTEKVKNKFILEQVSMKNKASPKIIDQMNDTANKMGSHFHELTSYGKPSLNRNTILKARKVNNGIGSGSGAKMETYENFLPSELNRIGNHDYKLSLEKHLAVKAKKVNERSGSGVGVSMDQYQNLSNNELIRSIRNIEDRNIKLALQSALKRDRKQLQNDVRNMKISYQESHRPLNLTSVLKDLVKAAENDERGLITSTEAKQGLMMKRRNSDKTLVRVKRLGNVRRRNQESERTLFRVKRIEDDTQRDDVADVQLVRVKRLDRLINDTNVMKTQSNSNANS